MLAAAARASLLNASLARLMGYGAHVEPRLQRTLHLLHSPERLQASLNLCQNTLRFLTVGLLLYLLTLEPAWFTTPVIALALLLAALVITLFEWLARSQAIEHPETWALRLGFFTQGLVYLFNPIASIALLISKKRDNPDDDAGSGAVDELKSLVDASQQEGTLELGESQMIYSIFELGDTLAREIMVPRIDVVTLDVETPLMEAVDALLASGYTRVPVYEDTIDNIVGLVYAKDLLRVWRQGDRLGSLRDLMRPAYFTPEAKKVDELLAEMQSKRIHMAIIVDEYGGVAGLVTLEDIVEEILGEIQDEYDQGEELPFVALADGEYLFQGRVDLDDFNEVLGSSLSKDEAETIGGFIYSQLGRVPANGEQVRTNDLLLTVEQVSGRRIRKVRARRAPSKTGQEELITDADE